MTALNTPVETYDVAADALLARPQLSLGRNIVSGMFAGIFIGVGFIFATTAGLGGADANGFGFTKVLGGLVFSGGLFATIVTGADLFTSATMTVLPAAQGRLKAGLLLRHWFIVYFANMLGAGLLAVIVALSGTGGFGNGAWGASAITAATGKVSHSWGEVFLLGVLCNFLVCLAVWLAFSGKSLIDKGVAVIFPISLFVASGFEHSVANMFAIPAGLLIKAQNDPTVVAALGDASTEALTWGNYIVNNLIPVTLGNTVAGVVFAMALFVWRRPAREVVVEKANATETH